MNFNSADSRFLATTSEKFQVVKTSEIVNSLLVQGFQVVDFKAQKVKNEAKQGFQRHEFQLTHPSLKDINGSKPRILLRNGHDATTPLTLTFGVYRMVCSNGLVIGTSLIKPVMLKHNTHGIHDKAIEATCRILDNSQVVYDAIEKFSSVNATNLQIDELSRRLIQLRLGDKKELINTGKVDHVRRAEDNANDGYTVFNRAQESMIRGGFSVSFLDKTTGKIEQTTLRQVNALKTTFDLNSRAWDIASEILLTA